MERNVTSFGVAIRDGHEPRLYTYEADKIPLGEFDAVLDFKAWSKRIIAINCYFTKIDTNEKFVLTVYYNNETKGYHIAGSAVNFADCATGRVYHVCTAKNCKNRIVVVVAEVL